MKCKNKVIFIYIECGPMLKKVAQNFPKITEKIARADFLLENQSFSK